jgi:hypothetical protein
MTGRSQFIDDLRKARAQLRLLRDSMQDAGTPVTLAAITEAYKAIVNAHEEYVCESRGIPRTTTPEVDDE